MKTYYVGQHFYHHDIFRTRKYILAEVSKSTINLISLDTGKSWAKSIKVKNVEKITKQEIEQLANNYNDWCNFELIGE